MYGNFYKIILYVEKDFNTHVHVHNSFPVKLFIFPVMFPKRVEKGIRCHSCCTFHRFTQSICVTEKLIEGRSRDW